jgi:hypothetical protein
MNRRICSNALITGLLLFAATNATTAYYIGNSFTDDLRYDKFKTMVESTGKQLQWGRHMIPGAPLSWLWEHHGALCEEPYGCYPNALQNYSWDFVTLQCHSRLLEKESDGDLEIASRFVRLARSKSPNVVTFIYTNWPNKSMEPYPGDYMKQWEQTYISSGNTWCTGDYYKKLVDSLRVAFANDKPENIRLVPNGYVLYEVAKRVKNGTLPGVSSVYDMYADDGHQTMKGAVLIASSLYSVFFKQSPVGISQSYLDDTALAQRLQQLAWEVVTSKELAPYTGVGTATAVEIPRRFNVTQGARTGIAEKKQLVTISGRSVTGTVPASGLGSRLHLQSAGAVTLVP